MNNSLRLQLSISCVLLVLILFQSYHYYHNPNLPNDIASHFDASGQPDGISSKSAFFGVYLALTFLMFFSFLGIGLLIKKIPPSLISLPNKEYWLSEEKKEYTYFIFQLMMYRITNVTLVFLIASFQLIIDLNITKSPLGARFWGIFGVYLLYTFVWTIQFFMKFRKPKEPSSNE